MLVAAQAGYAPSNYGSNKALIGGYAAQIQPAVTLTVLPSYGNGYGAGPVYGHGYNAAPSYVSNGYGQGYGHGPITIPYYSSSPASSYRAGVDAEALQLAHLALSLPSAGAPNPAAINIAHYPSTAYTAPVAAPSSHYGSAVNGASAAAAAANVGAAQAQPTKAVY